MSASLPTNAIKIFFSYATSAPQDQHFFERIITHLSLLKRQHLIAGWYDSAINISEHISQAIEDHLNNADIIVLLVSADFFASERCYEYEMQQALQRNIIGKALLIPVLLSPSEWNSSPLAQYSPLPPDRTPISLAKNRDAALTEVARGIRTAVENLIRTSKTALSHAFAVPEKISLHDIPLRNNPFFTDRDAILAILSSTFRWPQTTHTLTLALKGLGGIGKTQIALEYIRRSSHHYQTVVWLNASSYEVFYTEVNMLADKLAFSPQDREDKQHLLAGLKRWFQQQKKWLLVLDQVNDIAMVNKIIPPQSEGHVLLTTQMQAISNFTSSTIAVDSMPTDASITFLLHRAGLLTAENTLDQLPTYLLKESETVVGLMDGLPLALDQAGAYLEETGCSLASYINLYQKKRAVLLGQRGQLIDNDNHPDSVTITLALAFEQITQKQAVNLDLLRLLAFLQADAIPEEIITNGASNLRGPLRSLATQQLRLHQALADLRGFSFIHHNADRSTFSIHRIVQAVLIDQLTVKQRRQWATLVVRMVYHTFPEVRFDTRAECERYLQQAQHCAKLIQDYQLTIKEGPLLLERLGFYCYQCAYYAEAKTYLTQALDLYERGHQLESIDAAQVFNSLALLTHQQANNQEAEIFLHHALEIRERILGLEHVKTAESLHNLAMIYAEREKYQEAEVLYLRVLALEERIKGQEHQDVAKTLSNLGMIYYHQEKYQEAEALYQRARTLYKHHLPANHPDHIYPLDGLGALAEAQSDYQQAGEFYRQAFVISKDALGDMHPETAHSLNKLADIALKKGEYEQAEEYYRQALTIGEHVWGLNYPDMALFLNNLATLEVAQGHNQHAQELYLQAQHIYEQAVGPNHTWVASVLTNLGQLSQQSGNIVQAEEYLRQALAIYEQVFNTPHPELAQSMSDLADLLIEKQAYAEAETFFQQAIELLRLFDPQHPDIVALQGKYALLLKRQIDHEN